MNARTNTNTVIVLPINHNIIREVSHYYLDPLHTRTNEPHTSPRCGQEHLVLHYSRNKNKIGTNLLLVRPSEIGTM